jgi:tRNA (guanosine-2'-O-)-methyltransferase
MHSKVSLNCRPPERISTKVKGKSNIERVADDHQEWSDFKTLLTAHLAQYLTENRKASIEKVMANRTRHVTVVLEDIYQSHNASAVVRTCECMGLQDLHIIESRSKYGINKKVLKGSNKWVTMRRYKERSEDNTLTCLAGLRASGYRILAMDPSPDGLSLEEVPLTEKVALVMGNELKGISDVALDNADLKVKVPMVGFTESLNISVCAAVSVNILLTRLKKMGSVPGLSDREKNILRLEWYRKCVRGSDIIEREFSKGVNSHPIS